MNWLLVFTSVPEDKILGHVGWDGTELTVEGVQSAVEGMTSAEILAKYDGWSNGYAMARRVDRSDSTSHNLQEA